MGHFALSVAEPPDDPPRFVYDDGGRAAAGLKGKTGDCVARAIAIASGLAYKNVYDRLNEFAKAERPRGRRSRSSARTGVARRTYERLLTELGATWTPCMGIGSGCRVHLRREELPGGRLVVSVSRHLVAVIDGTIRDTHDPSRDGRRCVYGYFRLPVKEPVTGIDNIEEDNEQIGVKPVEAVFELLSKLEDTELVAVGKLVLDLLGR